MLQIHKTQPVGGNGLRIAIVAARYNEVYVNGMVEAAVRHLQLSGASVDVVRVPGAFEIPVAAARMVQDPAIRFDAVICLGVIWQGQTDHAQQIGGAVTQALMDLQMKCGVPCIHEVLTIRSEEQARARCLSGETNRGLEAAGTALEMGRLFRELGPSR
jgi:6,7-dimethyl-8-ribityllumazine synthase